MCDQRLCQLPGSGAVPPRWRSVLPVAPAADRLGAITCEVCAPCDLNYTLHTHVYGKLNRVGAQLVGRAQTRALGEPKCAATQTMRGSEIRTVALHQ